MNIETTQRKDATPEEMIAAMRSDTDTSEVSFTFSGRIMRMTGKEWNSLMDAALRGLRMGPRSL